MMIIDEVMSFWNFYEVVWLIVEGLVFMYLIDDRFKDCDCVCCEIIIGIGLF